MAGHSKWANIKHRKGAQDQKRAKIFAKIIKELKVAAKTGGSNPETNPTLRTVIAKAKSANLSKDVIERNISESKNDKTQLSELRFEGHGPCKTNIIVDCLTDNIKRTRTFVSTAFNKNKGSLLPQNSLSFLFERVGHFVFQTELTNDYLFEYLIDFNIEELKVDNSVAEIVCNPSDFNGIREKLESLNIDSDDILIQDIVMLAKDTRDLDDKCQEDVSAFVDKITDLDDVQSIYVDANY